MTNLKMAAFCLVCRKSIEGLVKDAFKSSLRNPREMAFLLLITRCLVLRAWNGYNIQVLDKFLLHYALTNLEE